MRQSFRLAVRSRYCEEERERMEEEEDRTLHKTGWTRCMCLSEMESEDMLMEQEQSR